MPKKPDFIFDVQIRIAEAFTLDSIARSPRTFKPKDVASACHNNELVLKEGNPPPEVISMATYMMTDFFAMAHGTGLYNRQKNLWEALSKVNSIAVEQLSAGLFKKKQLQVFDLYFLDYKQKPLVIVSLITELPEKITALAMLKQTISRAGGKNSLRGLLCCFPEPFPQDALEYVQKQTYTTDPVGIYESTMASMKVPIDLLELQTANMVSLSQEGTEPPELRTVFHLIHPDLKKGKHPFAPVRRPLAKKTDEEESESTNEKGESRDERAGSSEYAGVGSSMMGASGEASMAAINEWSMDSAKSDDSLAGARANDKHGRRHAEHGMNAGGNADDRSEHANTALTGNDSDSSAISSDTPSDSSPDSYLESFSDNFADGTSGAASDSSSSSSEPSSSSSD